MRVIAVQGDITTQDVDAVVNAANRRMRGGGGVDGAIHRAGGPDILAECRALKDGLPEGRLPRGAAVATTAGRLPARWVVHTAGPIWSASEDRSEVLRSCYRESLRVADGLGARTVATLRERRPGIGRAELEALVEDVVGVKERSLDPEDQSQFRASRHSVHESDAVPHDRAADAGGRR